MAISVLSSSASVFPCPLRPRAEGEGAGTPLTHSAGYQQEPQLHGQILGITGDK